VWRLYEDVCVLCAGLWFGAWRRNSLMSYSTLGGDWGGPREQGDDDLTLDGTFMRTVGQGIEGRPPSTPASPVAGSSGFSASRHKHVGIEGGRRAPPAAQPAMTVSASGGISHTRSSGRRVSAMSGWSAATKVAKELSGSSSSSSAVPKPADEDDAELSPEDALRHASARQIATTRALLQTFDAHTRFTLATLAGLLARDADAGALALTPKDIASFELGPLSALDARFVEWLVDEYAPGAGVSVKRGWRDLFGLILGMGS
jgi:hypothetical protein